MASRGRQRLVHVAKVPPSRSGVARYASRFARVLDLVGEVRTVVTGHEARDSARPSRVLEIVRSVRRELRHEPDVLVAELSGQAIGELLACAYVLRRRRRPLVWLTVHDPPALTGGLFWLTALDRRGLRRGAARLSNTVGRALERWVLAHADVVVCLSKEGSTALAESFSLSRTVAWIHPVAEISEAVGERHRVFVPGPVEQGAAIEVLEAVAPLATRPEVAIGFADPATVAALGHHAETLGIADRVRFTGFVSQEDLTALYESSRAVVYWRPGGPSAHEANRAACSYPVVDALASGCVVVTNAARGARAYIAESGAGVALDDAPGQLRDVLEDLLTSKGRAAELGQRARDFAARAFSPASVAAEVTAILTSTSPTPSGRQ